MRARSRAQKKMWGRQQRHARPPHAGHDPTRRDTKTKMSAPAHTWSALRSAVRVVGEGEEEPTYGMQGMQKFLSYTTGPKKKSVEVSSEMSWEEINAIDVQLSLREHTRRLEQSESLKSTAWYWEIIGPHSYPRIIRDNLEMHHAHKVQNPIYKVLSVGEKLQRFLGTRDAGLCSDETPYMPSVHRFDPCVFVSADETVYPNVYTTNQAQAAQLEKFTIAVLHTIRKKHLTDNGINETLPRPLRFGSKYAAPDETELFQQTILPKSDIEHLADPASERIDARSWYLRTTNNNVEVVDNFRVPGTYYKVHNIGRKLQVWLGYVDANIFPNMQASYFHYHIFDPVIMAPADERTHPNIYTLFADKTNELRTFTQMILRVFKSLIIPVRF